MGLSIHCLLRADRPDFSEESGLWSYTREIEGVVDFDVVESAIYVMYFIYVMYLMWRDENVKKPSLNCAIFLMSAAF